MGKRALFFEDARRMYVQQQCTVAEIASKLRLGEKTVRIWKDEGGWDRKRKEYLEEENSFSEDLFRLAKSLLKSIKDDLDAGEKVDAGRMYAFTKILPNFLKAKQFEDLMTDKEEAKVGAVSKEEIVSTIQQALGIGPDAPAPAAK